MTKKQHYSLSHVNRLLDCPFRLRAVGWMPEHSYVHMGYRIDKLFICLTFNSRGTGISEIDGRRVTSSGKDRLGIIWPGTWIQTLQPCVHDEIYFEYEASCEEAFRRLGLKPLDGIRFTEPVENIIREIRCELEHLYRPGAADRLDQLALRLFTEIALEYESMSAERHKTNLKVHDIASYFASHFHEKVDLDDLLRNYGFSRRTFYREWNRLYKISPVHFLLEQRMKLASELLRRSDCSLDEIALQCGFSDRIYFHQRFRQYFHCSPLQYRAHPPDSFHL